MTSAGKRAVATLQTFSGSLCITDNILAVPPAQLKPGPKL